MAMAAYALYSGLIQIEITRIRKDGLEESAPDMSAFTFRDREQHNESTSG